MLTALAFASIVLAGTSYDRQLEYRPSPLDNPLRGLVPYQGEHRGEFAHSMEFNYLPLSDLMKGRGDFDWTKLDALLQDVASRGHQTIFRIYVEYPGEPNRIPKFLADEGVKVIENEGADEDKGVKMFTPDYKDPRLASALVEFIEAMGRRYDRDPRIAYITAGLLGHWGEWHTYPRNDLAPSKALQAQVMDAYERSFRRIPVLVRYPALDDPNYAPNRDRRMGYHDDSFAWATLDTGKPEDSWFFMAGMKRAKATEQWKRAPIGGEIRPEAWGRVFDAAPGLAQIQDFGMCVRETHVTWLMDSGMFQGAASPERISRARQAVGEMGYEFTVKRVQVVGSTLNVTVENRGVAPFYCDWPVELGLQGAKLAVVRPGWKLTGILPGATVAWTTKLPKGTGKLMLRVPNPMPKGFPVRFANVDQSLAGWLTLRP